VVLVIKPGSDVVAHRRFGEPCCVSHALYRALPWLNGLVSRHNLVRQFHFLLQA